MWLLHLAALLMKKIFLYIFSILKGTLDMVFTYCTAGVIKLKADIFVPAGELIPWPIFLFALFYLQPSSSVIGQHRMRNSAAGCTGAIGKLPPCAGFSSQVKTTGFIV